jgi:hypothetical protein
MQALIARSLFVFSLALIAIPAQAQDAEAPPKPNILVVWGDDIGITNISHNSKGVMGYRTPYIDRIASEGIAFKDYPPRQKAASFSLDQVMETLQDGSGSQ